MDRTFRRKGQRKGRRARVVFLMVLLIVGVVILTQFLVISNVVVNGNSRYSAHKIIEMAQVPYGQSIFRFNEAKLANNFYGNGYVEFISAKVRFPNTLDLVIKEREPRALANLMGMYGVIDEDCVVIEEYTTMQNYLIPTVTGIKLSRYRVSESIKSTEPGQVEAISRIISAIYEDGAQNQIAELNVGDLDNLYMMDRNGYMIILGDATNMKDKLARMREAVAFYQSQGTVNGKIDVSGSKTILSQG